MFFDNIIQRLIKNINVPESWEPSPETIEYPGAHRLLIRKHFPSFLLSNLGSSYYKVTGSEMIAP